MRRISIGAMTLLVLFVFVVIPCFAQGGFTVTQGSAATFAGWASTANAKPLVGDFNGDGRADVALTGVASWKFLPVAFSKGDGSFNVTNTAMDNNFQLWAGTAGAISLVGDFNGDGKADVALTGAANWTTLAVAFSRGNGSFQVANNPITNFATWAATAHVTPLVGDFNGDGQSDVALTGASGWNYVPVAFSKGDGTFNVTNVTLTSNFAFWASATGAIPLVGDFNGDGKADVALIGAPNWTTLAVAFSNGDGSFNVTNDTLTPNFAFWAATTGAIPLVGDFNGDGKADVALTGAPNWTTLAVAFSNGDGTFNVKNTTITNFAVWAALPNVKPLVGDFNGDGKTDVALTGASTWNYIPVAFSNGDGSFNVTNVTISNFGGWAAISSATPLVGDFNADGRADVSLTGPSSWNFLPVAFSQTVKVIDMVPASLSGETHQDSEPFVALNPSFPARVVGTAFTPNQNYPNVSTAPIYLSFNSGLTWALNAIVPSNGKDGTDDITVVGLSDPTANRLYGGILSVPGHLSMKELMTPNFVLSTLMTTQSGRTQADQPFVQALHGNGTDNVYVGNKDFTSAPATSTVDVTTNGGFSWNSIRIDKRTGCDDHLPPVRPAVAADGTVYAAFFHCLNQTPSIDTSDVVVVRDDTWGRGTSPFTALTDPGDNLAGMRVVSNVNVPFDKGPALGNERIGSALSLAVNQKNSNVVCVGWGDRVGNGDIYTLHVRCSTNRGVTWSSSDLLTVTNATNIALAIGDNGTVGALYQQVTGTGTNQRWVTTFVEMNNAFVTQQQMILANVAVTTPAFQPYLGDYLHLLAVGLEFRGVFSADNTPNVANFPQGVVYQRQVNFTTQTLLNGTTTIASSVDPFYFSVVMPN